MPQLTTVEIIAYLTGLAGLITAAATWYKARRGNRNDERTQLSNEQIAFRQAMAVELSALRTDQASLRAANDKLEAAQLENVRIQERQTVRLEIADERIAGQKLRIEVLERENAELKASIASVTDEKVLLAHTAQVVQATKEFLERENSTLRQEIIRLQSLLPPRVEEPSNV